MAKEPESSPVEPRKGAAAGGDVLQRGDVLARLLSRLRHAGRVQVDPLHHQRVGLESARAGLFEQIPPGLVLAVGLDLSTGEPGEERLIPEGAASDAKAADDEEQPEGHDEGCPPSDETAPGV